MVHSVLLLNSISWNGDQPWFIEPFTHWRTYRLFPVFAYATNICLQVSAWGIYFLLLWDKWAWVQLLDHMVHTFLVLRENDRLFSRVAVPVCLSTSSVWVIQVLCVLTRLLSLLFGERTFWWCVVIAHRGFSFHFPKLHSFIGTPKHCRFSPPRLDWQTESET